MMEYGDTGISASRVGLGTWSIGGWMWGGTDEEEAIATIHAALDMGINLLDTAAAYGYGNSGEIVGRALLGGRRENAIAAQVVGLTYGALCRGLLSGRMSHDRAFSGDVLRLKDPKFQEPRYSQYLRAVERLDALARERFGKRVTDLALRLEKPGVGVALWGARKPSQLDAVAGRYDGLLDRSRHHLGDRAHRRGNRYGPGRARIHGPAQSDGSVTLNDKSVDTVRCGR